MDIDISDKQAEFLRIMEDPEVTELMIGGSAGGASVYGQEVKTPYGAKLIENIKIGDRICNSTGGVSNVIDIPFDGEIECYGVTFDDGAYTEVSRNHLWKYRIAGKKRNFGKRTGIEEFALGTTEQLLQKIKSNNVLIPLSKPARVTRNCASKKMPAYLLGVLLGDGSFCSGMITLCNPEAEIIDKCRELVSGRIVAYDNGMHWGLPECTLEKKYLEKTGLWGLHAWEKFIPDDYKYGSVEDRKLILQGLIDTDGSVGKTGGIRFGSTSMQLVMDVQFIARSLGANAKLTQNLEKKYKNREGNIIHTRPFFEVYIQHEHKEWFVSTTRKLNRLAQNNENFCNCKRIVSIEPIGIKKCRCISTSATDGLYLTNDFILTHNSKSYCIGLIVALWARKYPGVRFFVGRKTLKSLKQSTINTMLSKVFPALGITTNDYHMGWQNMELTFKNGSMVIFGELDFAPSDPVYSRVGSFECDCAIIDEAGEVPKLGKDAIKSRTGRGVMANYGMPGKLLLASNPDLGWLKDEYFTPYEKLGAKGFEKWKIGEIDGKPTYRAFLRMGAYDNPFLPQSYIDNLKTLPPILRKRLLDGDWNYADDESSLFRAGLLDKSICFEQDEPHDGEIFIGVDLSDSGSDKTIFSLMKNGVLIRQKVSSVQMNWEKDSKLPMGKMITNELVEFAQRNGIDQKLASHIAVEVNGVGASVRDELRSRGWQVIEYTATHKSRSENYYNLMMDMDAGDVKIFECMQNIDELRRELMAHSFTMNNQEPDVVKKDKIKQTIGHSPDFADSFMICNYARRLAEHPELSPHTNRNRLYF